jgi:hypothetical protein
MKANAGSSPRGRRSGYVGILAEKRAKRALRQMKR